MHTLIILVDEQGEHIKGTRRHWARVKHYENCPDIDTCEVHVCHGFECYYPLCGTRIEEGTAVLLCTDFDIHICKTCARIHERIHEREIDILIEMVRRV